MTASARSVLVVLGALLLGVPWFATFYTDWLWFGEVGYQPVFVRTLAAQSTLFAVGFVIALAIVAPNLLIAMRSARRREFVVVTPDGPRTVSVDPARLTPTVWLASIVASAACASYAQSHWDTWLLFRNGTPFNAVDPVLGYDAGFYVFTLPFLQALQRLGLLLAGGTLVATVAVYVMAGAVGMSPRRGIYTDPPASTHLAAITGVLFLLLATGAWLSVPAMMSQVSGIIHGASFTDVAARIPALRLLAVVSVISAGLAVAQAAVRSRWPLFSAIGLYMAVALGGELYASAVQRFVVAPNEQAKETPFIVHNVAATRRAFKIDGADERQLSGDALLSRADIERNAATIDNVPLWDHQPLLDTFGQIQEIRTYYDFVSAHNDRYWIDGKYRQVMLAARELNSKSLPNRTWINEHLTFTHGYGITLGPVNEVTAEGLPVLFIKNLPPESSVDLTIDEPSIYFGDLSEQHVFVNTATKEFHYPRGEDNVYSVYNGTGGVAVGSFWRKALFSIRFGSLKTLLTNDISPESRVLFHRRVADRVRQIAPFLTYEDDRYLSIADGRLYWVQDAYTTSGRYPYATPAAAGINYIRNSVKVTVDAYNGTTTFYLVDPGDPIALTLQKMFPSLLKPLSAMPEGLRTRLRYPQGIFEMQARMFATYHMTNPAVFYNKEDQWEVPTIERGARGDAQLRGLDREAMQPWYTIMKLPGEKDAEFIQMLPFTPRNKDNLASWMVARSDGENYGQLVIFQFPKQKVVYGPRQVIARINQDQNISPQITLWSQQGSEVIQGTLLVIPIEESLLYIRPLYLRSEGGRIPELKRVIVAYQNRIVMEPTLGEAIARIFPPGGGETKIAGDVSGAAMVPTPTGDVPAADVPATAPPGAAPGPGAATAIDAAGGLATSADAADLGLLAARANAAYLRATDAQRAGDWAKYGEEMKLVGELLERMARERRPQ